MTGEFISIARVFKTQGRHGEVAAEILTDFPERFSERRRVFAVAPNGECRELILENFWEHKGAIVLKFSGVDSITDAEALIGAEIQVPMAERVPLDAGANYIGELVGCEVRAGGRVVGTVADVQFGAGEAPLLVVRDAKKEYLVPFAQAYLRSVDIAGKKIEMELPDGMLELDAPLTAEEKELQRKKVDGPS